MIDDQVQSTPAELPLVSVVLPTYNRARTLPRAIASVLAQDYANIELLVVDDASQDDSEAVVRAIADPRLRYIKLDRNGGASRARNEGMKRARGDFIAFQDSDDEWLAGKLSKQVAAAKAAQRSAVTVFHTKILYGRDPQGRYGPQRVCCLPEIAGAPPYDFKALIQRSNLISPQALMISRAAYEVAGCFDEDLVNNEDWAFGIDLFFNTEVVFIDEPLVMTYLQSDSISTLMRRGARAQLRVMQKLRRIPGVDPKIIGGHLARIGWGISKLGYPRMGLRLLQKSVKLQPAKWKNWARMLAALGVTVLPAAMQPRRPLHERPQGAPL